MNFTQHWFTTTEYGPMIETLKLLPQDRPINMLEIGSYEGQSACNFAKHLIHPNSLLYCVDPFTTDPCVEITTEIYDRFRKNISLVENSGKIKFHRLTSDEFFTQIFAEQPNLKFDFVYIDGAHTVENIQRDLANSLQVLRSGGILWIDDYLGGGPPYPFKQCIDNFLHQERNRIRIQYQGYRVCFVKI